MASSRVKWNIVFKNFPRSSRGFTLSETPDLTAGKWIDQPVTTFMGNTDFLATRKRAGTLSTRGEVVYHSNDFPAEITLDFEAGVNFSPRLFSSVRSPDPSNLAGTHIKVTDEIKTGVEIKDRDGKIITKKGNLITTTIEYIGSSLG